MTSPTSPRSGTASSLIPIVLVTVFAAALRLNQIGQSLYGDEMWSYVAATSPDFGGLLDFVRSDQEITPPLYPTLAWLSVKLGDPAVTVRLPTVIAGIATIPLVWAIGVRTLGRRVALIAAALAALSPFLAFYAVEARAYAVAIAFVSASTLFMLIALERRTIGWWVAYAAATCAAMYSHYTSAYILGAQLAWLLWFHRDQWRPALAASVVAALAYLPWVPGLLEDLDSPTVDTISVLAPFDPHNFVSFTGSWAFGHPSNGLRTFWGLGLELVLAAGVAIAIAGLVVRLRGGDTAGYAEPAPPPRREPLILVVLLSLATPAAVALVSLVGDDMYIPRNIGASWPFWSIALAALLTAGPRPFRIAATSLVVIAFAIGAFRTTQDDWQRPDIGAAAGVIDASIGPDDVVLDAVSGVSDVSLPPAQTLDIQLDDPHRVIDVTGLDAVAAGVEDAAGGRLAVVGPPQFVDALGGAPGLAGLEPVEDRTFAGLVPTTVRVYEVPTSEG